MKKRRHRYAIMPAMKKTNTGMRGAAALAALCLLAAGAAGAFDSAAWMERRDDLANEVGRLRDAYGQCAAKADSPAEDVSLPVETFPNGSVKTSVQAKKAQYFLDSGLVWADGVVVRAFKKDGSADATLEAQGCVVDRLTRSGWADGAVKIVQGGTTFRGRGVYFSSPEEYVRVTKDSELESVDFNGKGLENGKAALPAALAAPSSSSASTSSVVRIRSATSDFDRRAGVVLFDGSTVVEYGDEYTLCADRVFAFLTASNRLSRVVASGNVVVSNGLRVGTCALATYRRAKGEIEMFGERGGAKARLVERGERTGEIDGDRIRFWLAAEEVEVSNSRISAEHDAKAVKDVIAK